MNPVLETERLSLQKFTLADAPFILELLNEPSFIQNIGDRGVQTVSDAERYLETGPLSSYARNGFGLYRVALKGSGESIGMCGLIRREALEDVDLGYAFLPRFWGQGYAVEAALACKEYAGDPLGLKRLVAIVDPANRGSIRVLKKVGMQFEKMIRLSANDVELQLFSIDI
jgi:RimJ/RimL family protein N-acetyltransferase